MQRRRKGEKKSGKVDQYKRDSGHEVWDAGVPLFTRTLSVKDRTKIKKRKKKTFPACWAAHGPYQKESKAQ
jgi:hypothetical protein